MAVSDINAAMAAAITALDSGDYATALRKALAAQGYMAVLPDSEMHQRTAMKWDPQKIEQFIQNVRRQQAAGSVASGGLSRTCIKYVRETSSDTF